MYGIEGFSPHQIDVSSTNPILPGEYDEIYAGSKINIKLSTNFDEDPLKSAAEYEFYLIQVNTDAELRTLVRNSFDVNKDTDLYSDPAAKTMKSNIKRLVIPAGNIKASGSNYVATVVLENLSFSSYYILQVRGSDQSDSPDHTMVADPKDKTGGQYIFKMMTIGAKPEVRVTRINGKDPQAGRFYIGKGSSAAFDVVLKNTPTGNIEVKLIGSSGEIASETKQYSVGNDGNVSPVSFNIPKDRFVQDKSAAYRITVQATDTQGAGSSLIQEYQLYYDVEGPVISANVSGTVTALPTITGDIYDAGIGVDYGTVQATYKKPDGTEQTLTFYKSPTAADNTWRLNSLSGGEGRYKITLTARDTLGNTATKELEFTYDAATPQITEVKVGDKGVRNGDTVYSNEATVKISVKATDTYGIKEVEIGGYAATLDSNGFWVRDIGSSSSPLSAGEYAVNIIVKDKADKEISTTVTLFVDKAAPLFTTLKIGGTEYSSGAAGGSGTPAPAPAEIITYKTPVTLEGTVTDSGNEVQKVEYSLNAADPTPEWTLLVLKKSGTNYTFNGFTSIAVDNTKTVTLQVTDNAGNTARWERSVKVLSDIPDFAIEVPPLSGITDSGTPIRKGPFTIRLGCYVDGALGTKEVDDIIVTKGSAVIAKKTIGFGTFFDGWTSTSMLKVKNKTDAAPTDYTVKAGLASGEYTITLKEKGITRTGRVIIDETGPNISLINPTPDAKHNSGDTNNWAMQHLFGKVLINGSLTDASIGMNPNLAVGSAHSAYTCRIGKSESPLLPTDRFKLLSTSAWSLEIASAEKYCENDTYVLEKYNSENILDPTNGKVFKIPLYITAKDKLNNETKQTFYIMIASDGKMPQLTIQSPPQAAPSAEELALPPAEQPPVYNGLKVITVGGLVGFSGVSQTLNPSAGQIRKIYVRFSNNEHFSGNFTREFKGHTLDLATANGVVAASSPTNLVSWQFTVDAEKFLDGADRMQLYYTVQAENNEGTKSSWTPVRCITLDKKAPYFKDRKIKKGTTELEYANNTLVKDGDMLICDLLSTSDIGKIEVTSETAGASYLAPLASLSRAADGTDTAITSVQIDGTAVFTRISGAPNAPRGYKMTLPLKLANLSDPDQIFSVKVKLTDTKTGNDQGQNFDQFNVKYDKTKPAAVFGKPVGKFGKGTFTKSGTSVTASGIDAASDGMDKTDLFVFVETKDGSAASFEVTDTGDKTISFTASATTDFDETSTYILVRKNRLIFDPSSNYQIEGFAYDTGSGVKDVKAAINTTSVTITAFTGELGSFSSFKESFKTFDIDDGQQTLTLTVSDKAGNTGNQASDTVYLRNKPLKISKVHFKTDLDYGGTYENVSKRGLVEIVTESGSDSHVNNEKNYVQDLDIHKRFAFKNGTKSQIAFELAGGKGTARTYEIYAVGSDGKPLPGAYIKRGILTDNAGQKVIDLSPADFTGATSVFSEGAEKKFAIVLRDEAAQMNTGTGNVSGDAERKLTFTVTIGVKTVDNRKPQILILPFYWNSEDDNSLAEHKQSNGHIEIARVSVDSSGNPSLGVSDVSGKVVVRGTAYHPARLTKLQLTVPNTASSTSEVPVTAYYHSRGWTDSTVEPPLTPDPPVPSALKVTDERIDVNGHWVAWEYVWDTGTPVVNKEIKAAAWHNTMESAAATAGSLESKTAQERADKQSLKLHGDHSGKAVAGQFLRLYKDERSYLVTINRVNDDGSVEWRLIDVPTDITDYYLYPVYTTDTAGYNKPNVKINIVPYITGIETPLSIDGGAEPDLYARTALGRYPVKDEATITVKGFNLKASDATGAACAIGGVASGKLQNLSADGTSGELTLASSVKSGTLTAKVNGIEAVNNKNSNKKDYHKGAKTANNKNLTDDVELDVWQFNDKAALPGRGYVAEPVMHINPQNGIIGFAFANGPDTFSMTKGQGSSYEGWHKNYDDFANVDFIYDSTGVSHGVVVGRDINSGENHAGKFTYVTGKWGPASSLNDGNNYNGSNALRLEAIGQLGKIEFQPTNNWNQDKKYAILDKTRIQHPSLAAAGAGNPRIYLAYYDSLNDQIRFKAGELPSGGMQSFGQFVDQETSKRVTAYNQNNVSIIAGSYKDGTTIKQTGNKPGTYLSLGVVSGANADADVAVLVWFDATNKKLKYTYKKKPQTAHHAGAVSLPENEAWAAPKDVFGTKNIGAYCKLVVDKNGGIHIAAYSTDTKDLHYAYLPSYNASSFTTSAVDSYGITGSQIRLDVALSANGNPIPYIGYYSPSAGYAKLAYLVDKSSGFDQGAAGVNDGYFTGDWEITCIPTTSELVEDNINVGVWKGADGKIKESVSAPAGLPAFDEDAARKKGTVYGNGTANPVLGYATTQSINGFLETAQKK